MGLFDRSSESKKNQGAEGLDLASKANQLTNQSTENTKPENIELEIAELFHVNEDFLRDVEKELNVQQERVEKSAKIGLRLYEDARGGVSEVALASFTLPLGKETKDPSEIPELIAAAWNNNQVDDNRDENALAQVKALLSNFGLEAAKDQEYRTAILAIGLAAQPQSLLQNREAINQIEQVCSQAPNSRHAKYYMINAIKEYELAPDKQVLKVLRPAPASAAPEQPASSLSPTSTMTPELRPQAPSTPTITPTPELNLLS